MKCCNLMLLVLLLGLVFQADINAQIGPRNRRTVQNRTWWKRPSLPPSQRAVRKNSNRIELNLGYEFSVPGKTSNIRFVALVPRTIPDRQKILDINCSPRASRIFTENRNCYAEFIFIKPKKRFKVQINVKAELFRYDLSTARKNRQRKFSTDITLKNFLRHEKYLEKDHPRIQQIAKTLTGRDEIDIVKEIYLYVIENLEYKGLSGKDFGAVKAVERKHGDCSEYADLFVALCRAKNIPARFVTGYIARFDNIALKHHWAEVYLQDHGWVPFDPSKGDVQSTVARTRAFEMMSPGYVYLSHIRNDKVLYNKHFYFFTHWGDRASLKDSIEFKQLVSAYKKDVSRQSRTIP